MGHAGRTKAVPSAGVFHRDAIVEGNLEYRLTVFPFDYFCPAVIYECDVGHMLEYRRLEYWNNWHNILIL